MLDIHGREVSAGMRLRLLEMPRDPCPLPAGATGRVTYVQSQGKSDLHQLWVDWEPPHAERSLMLVSIDRFEVV